MLRKLTLLLLFAFGTLCLVAGTIERKLSAANCTNNEPDTGIYCPAQSGDSPNDKCDNPNWTQMTCENLRTASGFYGNVSYMKYSKDSYAQLKYASWYPVPLPATLPCYMRTYCEWKDGKCQNGKQEYVLQYVYEKTSCP